MNLPVLSRVLRVCLPALLLGSSALAADDLTLVRVLTGWRDTASFKRIAEYFDGREHTGGQVVLRTHPESRDGFYFLVRVANTHSAGAVRFRLQVILPGSDRARTFAFPADAARGGTVFNLGLTGPDWPASDVHPVAWKLDVLATDGATVLATKQSYLWADSAGK